MIRECMEDSSLIVYEMGNMMVNLFKDFISSVDTATSVTEENLRKRITPDFVEKVKELGWYETNCTEWVDALIHFSVNNERKEVYVTVTPDFGDGKDVYGEPEVFEF